MVLSGLTIRELGIIEPHVPRMEVELAGVKTTYGESYAGYDLRLQEVSAEEVEGGWLLLPGAFALAVVHERISMPNDLVGIVHDKSSWARRGLAVQNTVVEPGWCGYLTLELTNHGVQPLVLPKGCGICQILFHKLDRPTEGYRGKYQNQPPRPVGAL